MVKVVESLISSGIEDHTFGPIINLRLVGSTPFECLNHPRLTWLIS